MKILRMPLPTEERCGDSPRSVGVEDGERGSLLAHRGLSAVLDLPLLDHWWCAVCECEEQFTRVLVIPDVGIIGCCRGCGDERLVHYTHEVTA